MESIVIYVIIVILVLISVSKKNPKRLEQQRKRMQEMEVDKQIGQTSKPGNASKTSSLTFEQTNFGKYGGASSGNASPANLKPVHTMNSSTYQGRSGSSAGPARQAVAQQKTAQQRNGVQNNRPQTAKQKPGEGGLTDADELSTTEMLAEKARKDQIEHHKEQVEHRQHEQKYYGNYHYARRYMLGDPVAASDKLIYCPNCAAENLIKLHESPRKYNCYFCRAKLDGSDE